jgi:SHS2 domain-containing protein
MTDFELIDHTADVGIRARGTTLAQVFENAARGMFSILTDADLIVPRTICPIKVHAMDQSALLVRFLSELLYKFETEQLLFKEFKVQHISETHLEAVARGEKLDLTRHTVLTEIKSATYHLLKVEEEPGGWVAEVIFDL